MSLMLITLMLQAAPMPVQVTPVPTAGDFTRPLLSVDCAVEASDGATGRLAFDTTGGRAFVAGAAPAAGEPVAAGFRRMPQVVHVRLDELRLLDGAENLRVEMGGHGGEVGFRKSLFGAARPAWWQLATFVEIRAGSDDSQIRRVELVDASGHAGYVTGVRTIRPAPQAPLAPEEIAMESAR